MDPMERVKLERRIDALLTAKDGDVRSIATKAQAELKAKHWSAVEPLVKQAEELWFNNKPQRVLDLLVQKGSAASVATARRMVQSGNVRVNGVVLRKPFSEVGPNDRVEVGGKDLR